MNVSHAPDVNAAHVLLIETGSDLRAVDLPHGTVAFVDAVGELVAIETHVADRWGVRFDERAATRLVEWVREQLANAAA